MPVDRRAYFRRYHQEHKEHRREVQNIWRQKHRDKLAAYARTYRRREGYAIKLQRELGLSLEEARAILHDQIDQ